MISIFYDFETSSRDPLGQILSYAFIAVDKHYTITEELNGLIKVNRTQLPEIDAILTNKLNIDELNNSGHTDYEAAKIIYHFLEKQCKQYNNVTLAGFNSNQFDLTFLRNLLISYGFNPYFKGKLHNKDVLHFAQFIAFQHPDQFPWIRTESEKSTYYSFKLEDLATTFGILTESQTHNARDDVLLTINLIQTLETTFETPFHTFEPTQFIQDPIFQGPLEVGKQKVRHYTQGDELLKKFTYRYFVKIASLGKAYLLIDLSHYETLLNQDSPSNDDKINCLRYINPNKAFFIFEPLIEEERLFYSPLAESILEDQYFLEIKNKPDLYFKYTKKNWDIAYQIHELGFERIETLHTHIKQLISAPDSYTEQLNTLLQNIQTAPNDEQKEKNRYLLTLFNRAYLNHHPAPNPVYLQKYMTPRYETGTLLRNSSDFIPLKDQLKRIDMLLNATDSPNNDTTTPLTEEDQLNLTALKRHMETHYTHVKSPTNQY